jgi:hypothetical protein
MNIIYIILNFCLVLFFYIHIYFHLKTSNDLEIYEIEQPSKDRLEEICDLRQPVLFDFKNERLLDSCRRSVILDTYGAFDIKIRNVENKDKDKQYDDTSELFVTLPFSSAIKTLNDDIESKYLVESSGDFLEETGLVKNYKYNDSLLRPYMVSSCNYDFIIGSNKTTTPFRYELNYRTYFLVTEGEIKIKLAPPKSSKYLYPVNDYENFEFRSPVNTWNVQAKYRPDFDKIKCLEMNVKKGQIVFIPAYWWYSILFNDEQTSICAFKYKTYMSSFSILPKFIMRLLQNQNIKHDIISKYQDKDKDIIEEKNDSIQETSL